MNDTREYTIWNTPLSVLLRGRLGPAKPGLRRDPLALIHESSLPGSVKALIARVVKRTRLWKSEKQQIAEELLAHFADGLDAGHSADDLIASFGDPTQAAKLMRRAKKRNRPLWWKLFRGAAQAFACLILLYIAVFIWLFLAHPNPSTNYVASLNDIARAAPSEQCAWPIYRPALIQAGFAKVETPFLRADLKTRDGMVAPGDPDWPSAKAFLDSHQELLAAFRTGSAKQYLGLRVGDGADFSPEDRSALGISAPAQHDDDPLMQDVMLSVLLPHLTVFRQAGNILALDMRDAAAAGDPQRFLADYQAIRGVARQLREQPVVVNYLVATGLDFLADEQVRWAISNHPSAVALQSVDLLHAMAPMPSSPESAIVTERHNVLDVLQRVYSDSGNGNGYLTVAGVHFLQRLGNSLGPLQRWNDQAYSLTPLTPIVATVVVSRKEATRVADRYFSLVEQDLRRPAWQQLREPSSAMAYFQSLTGSTTGRLEYAPLVAITPDLSRYGQAMVRFQATHQALMTALSLDVYHSRVGQYPKSLSDLVPQYLPEVPLDLSTGQPLLYRLQDGRPLLYGRGLDSDDDGGVWAPVKRETWPGVPSGGDWVLYPEPPRPE